VDRFGVCRTQVGIMQLTWWSHQPDLTNDPESLRYDGNIIGGLIV
jgi:hypothetical protein